MKFDSREDIIQLTPLWEGERFPNGRPKVPTEILRRMENITLEEAWGSIWGNGYRYQFQGDFKMIHPNKKMVGRAVTAVMVPMRPDLNDCLLKYGHEEEGRRGFFNAWVVDSLQEDDVLVVDMFDKIFQGTYVGGNLSTAVAARTKRGGSVIWGGIRDVEQNFPHRPCSFIRSEVQFILLEPIHGGKQSHTDQLPMSKDFFRFHESVSFKLLGVEPPLKAIADLLEKRSRDNSDYQIGIIMKISVRALFCLGGFSITILGLNGSIE